MFFAGVYGIGAGHEAIVSELKAGVVEISKGGVVTKYFIPGGYAFTHADSRTHIATVSRSRLPLHFLMDVKV